MSSSMVVYQPNSSIQSSSFTPPPPPREYEYDLFLSFRGEDTRHNFVDHICKELRPKGIHFYIDNEKLQEIGPEVLKVIEESKFSIVVLSTNYASSRWCLNELVKILECKATTSAVYPVFYYVDPSDVGNQAGDFGKGFEKLLSLNDTMDSDEVQRWKDALKEVGSLTKEWVYPSQKIVRSEAKFIEELVGDIISKLYRPYSGSGSAELFSSANPCSFETGPLTRQPALGPNWKILQRLSVSYHECLPSLLVFLPNLTFLEIPGESRPEKCYSPEAFLENTKCLSNISQLGHFMMVDRFEIDDFSFLGPFLGCYLTRPAEHLNVTIVSSQYIFEWSILYRSASIKHLESERHSFCTPSLLLPLDQLDFLSIINSMSQLMGNFLENLEINGCPSMPFPIKSKLATNLRQLKITNCTSLQLLPVGLIHNKSSLEMLHIQGCPSLISFPESEPTSPDFVSNTFLKLITLEIWDCVKLKSLPLGLHRFSFLSILSISNCPRLVSFPEEGLPSNLTSLLISKCESLRFLPDNMHKLASLQVLSIYGCPSLTFFPEGGLPTNLLSLSVIDCENLCPLYQWELHKLIELEQFTVMGVCSHLDLQ